jgi:hypothetical protein
VVVVVGGGVVVLRVRVAVVVAEAAPRLLLGAVLVQLALAPAAGPAAVGRRARALRALPAPRDVAGLDLGEKGLAGDLVAALDARRGGEGAVALDELGGVDAGLGFEVVDVLGVVG